jgi:SNF family Na+-dependent transporter
MGDTSTAVRERWGTRIGLILAAAGNAIGIGNFLRFPSKAAVSGGGAFIVPYVCALLFLGIPMMWVAWGVGRHGGKFGHTSTPGMFARLWNHPLAKYLGVLGLAIPLSFAMYYTYIESWMLGYAWQCLTGSVKSVTDYAQFTNEYQGIVGSGSWFNGLTAAATFAAVTLVLNVLVLWRGVAKGIETLAKIAMPLLFVFAIVLMIKTLSLPASAEGSVSQGLAYVWVPDWSRIGEVAIWVTAAGQIFYSLSIGMGSLECYAGYLRDKDDVVLTGLTTSATNELVEVIMGGSIAIPATAVFLGSAAVQSIAEGGTFNLGLVAMPQVLVSMGGVQVFGTMWFLLLFFAAFTSSIAVAQPIMAFFQDETKLSRGKAVGWLTVLWILGTVPCIIWAKYGFWEEIDFWAGTMLLIVFAFIEVILFFWIFGSGKAWDEMHQGADIRIPRIFYFIIKYVTPLYLLALLVLWPAQALGGVLNPSPNVTEGIKNRAALKGPVKVAEHGGAASAELKKWVSANKADARVSARVSVDAAGKVTDVTVTEGTGEPARIVEEQLRKRVYQPYRDDPKGGAAQPVALDVVIEGLYTTPYIWASRALMAGVFILFCILTCRVWKNRTQGAPV